MSAYGDLKTLKGFCGASNAYLPILGEWQHGWHPLELDVTSPTIIVGTSGNPMRRRRSYRQYLGNQNHESILKDFGFKYTRTIGYPFIYTRSEEAKIKGKVLVLPPHGIAGAEMAPDDALSSSIRNLGYSKSDCQWVIHAADWNGPLHNNLRASGWECIPGADPKYDNSLQRTRNLFDQAEVVVGFSLGSYAPYAAYCGAKVKVVPEAIEAWPPIDNLKIYQQASVAERKLLRSRSEWFKSGWRQELQYSHFLDHKSTQKEQQDWAKRELGLTSKLTRADVLEEFGWNLSSFSQLSISKLWAIQKRLWLFNLDADIIGPFVDNARQRTMIQR